MPKQPHSDDLFRFSYRVFKIEFILAKLFFFAVFLFGLYKLGEQEFGWNMPHSPPRHEVPENGRIPNHNQPRVPPPPNRESARSDLR